MEKIARLCWNTNGWRRPSGKEGKSKSKESYERDKGFGHEEWLLDDSKNLPDGYHYGFLEQLHLKSDIHNGKVYNIHIYTITPSFQRVYLGCLKNAVGVSPKESVEVYKYYQKNGWLDEMKQDVLFIGGTTKDFKPNFMFNVKFKFDDAEIYYSNQPVLKKECIPSHRYNLLNMTQKLEFDKDENGDAKMLDISIFERAIGAGKVLIDPLHKKIQNIVAENLKGDYSDIQLETNPAGLSEQRIDIKGFSNKDKEWHFFEVKTVSAKRCIREALGQILEYAHYPNENRAKKFYIIGPEPADDNDKAYIKFLRDNYSLPIWYRWCSLKEKRLFKEV